ncbi:30S ribosomal protein S12 methylthiotransferase RimO [Parabacteroides distasonis]|uniref:30S ribosomal protein S12 methylthiotransferase RimO n=1 Tax=Parabacteroides distasonis TaxID=823 RepID=UPI00189E4B33|nr:30S ribosomal protein S12 methylthiotransferase RimO [Parabacteroides distasonis]MDB9152554.1 30S ribosomal protein S12 methylthiotransferase RimO [Parabacteroides distasonis]MDB9157130.1 30S ribosomal protein S12 methylthiotransferase RimO [Parabacteroides distasonis]MDB9166144.1 30S ribosomal protein S12 methylthiotransferase RimO [Parabacteroides distasonis]MDB9170564.1 30S ribosomal protein S12 methylthiotransferase RimO [Parabacteroides distasonis]MDB9192980.1 30S ribosomal protein S12
MRKNKVDIITLGCSKNLVDSEQLMRQFVANGYTVEHDPHKINGEIVVVNTCGFIGDAQEESINMILELGEQKQKGRIGKLFVMGCLSERFLKDLEKELPEVDRFYGKFNWKELISDLGKSYHQELATERVLTTPRHYAYVKIGEGCNRTCSYCSIPIITGAYQSRPMDEIVDEVRGLVAQGVKEFQMIAQDLTFYGLDRYKRMALPELVERVSDIPGVEWIRLHYGYPSHFPYDLLPVMRERDNVCKYMDIALQHISDPMLKMMRRNITKAETYELLERMRREVPGIHLRTTLMVGHPGETEQDFEELIRFVKDIRFERMGAFAYSHEEGTYAYLHYKDEIPQEVKQERLDYLMRVQEGISADVNASKVGQTFRVIVDREEEDFYVGRTQYDSPEVDPEILISKDTPLSPGSFYQVKVIDAQAFDLYGKVLN